MATQPEDLIAAIVTLRKRLRQLEQLDLPPVRRAEIDDLVNIMAEFITQIEIRKLESRQDFDPERADRYISDFRELSDKAPDEFARSGTISPDFLERLGRANTLMAMRGGGARRWPR